MCCKLGKTHFSHIFFEHGYLTYYKHYRHDNCYTCCRDLFGGKRVSEF